FDVFAGKKSAQIREILISESAWEEMTCLFAPSLTYQPPWPLLFSTDVTTKSQINHQLQIWSRW
ncbi:hypothetical protein, partial [Klebsiella pneumoniae]|uniref:hypothetical protein n=2 Tax=Klebsiella pneumoniae TaxID=573 RepID=UPI00403C6160